MAGFPFTRKRGCGGSATARDLGDVAEADHASVGDEVDGQDVLLGAERPGDADGSFSSPVWTTPAGVTAFWACRADISACQLIPSPPSARSKTRHGFFRPAHPRRRSWTRPAPAGASARPRRVLQLAMAEAVRGETVDDAVGVAELVVEAGPDDALWQGGGCRRSSCGLGTRCPGSPYPGSSRSG